MRKRKSPEPTKADRFREAVKKFAASPKECEDVNSIIIAGWVAMQQGEGLVFEEVRQILKEELGKNDVMGIGATGSAADSESEG